MQVSGQSQIEDVHALARSFDADGDGLISLDEWSSHFPGLLETDGSTQVMTPLMNDL